MLRQKCRQTSCWFSPGFLLFFKLFISLYFNVQNISIIFLSKLFTLCRFIWIVCSLFSYIMLTVYRTYITFRVWVYDQNLLCKLAHTGLCIPFVKTIFVGLLIHHAMELYESSEGWKTRLERKKTLIFKWNYYGQRASTTTNSTSFSLILHMFLFHGSNILLLFSVLRNIDEVMTQKWKQHLKECVLAP